jgi:hypothetical protein
MPNDIHVIRVIRMQNYLGTAFDFKYRETDNRQQECWISRPFNLIIHRSRDSNRDFGNCRVDPESQLNDNAQYPIGFYPSHELTAPEGRDAYRFSSPLDSSPGWGEM